MSVMGYPGLNPTLSRRKRSFGLASAMNGSKTFSPQVMPSTSPQVMPSTAQSPELPANYGFPELAGYEETRRRQFGNQSQSDILGYGQDVARMGQGLRNQIQANQANVPGIFSDLGTAENQAQNQFRLGQQNGFAGFGQSLAQRGQAMRGQVQANQGQIPGFFNQAQGQVGSDAEGLRNQIRSGTANNLQAINRGITGYGQRADSQRGQLGGTYTDLERQLQGNNA